jgi:uncharacterized membrane protein
MKARLITGQWPGALMLGLIIASAFQMATRSPNQHHLEISVSNDKLKKEAFKILDLKCNICHRKQNPFMVFKEKNMSRRAKKIYKMVFVERRMPKGNEIRLTNEEYNQLEEWLKTQEI